MSPSVRLHCPGLGRSWQAEAALWIGRHEWLDVHLTDRGVSRSHARVRWDGGRWTLQDLNSRNGTSLNGEPVEGGAEAVALMQGDQIRVAGTELVVEALRPPVSAASWASCQDAGRMLRLLRTLEPEAERKPRMVAYAAARSRLNPHRQRAFDEAERYADGEGDWFRVVELANELLGHTAIHCTTAFEDGPVRAITADSGWEAANAVVSDRADIVRDVFGPLPGQPAAIDPRWLTWDHGMVRRMAAAIYAERRFEDLPVLADALADAGCEDAALLAHCRTPAGHWRGCWVLDRLLGRD